METKITSFEAACEFMGYPVKRPDVSGLPEHLGLPNIADYEISVINEALNKEALEKEKSTKVFPNWNDASQWKYLPWWKIEATEQVPSGVGVSYDVFVFGHSASHVGSRFLLLNSSLVEYSKDQFHAIHEMRMIGPKK